jgi:hypothetical protein
MMQLSVYEVDTNKYIRTLEINLATEVVPRVGDHLLLPAYTKEGTVTKFWELVRVVHDFGYRDAAPRVTFYVKNLKPTDN